MYLGRPALISATTSMTVSSAPSSDSKSKLMISLAESKEQELSTPAQRMPCPKETGCKSLNYLVEREGLEPAGGLSRISNLLIPLELLSPALPLDPRIWHSIWHWADAAPSRYSCNRHVEADLACTELQRGALAAVPWAPGTAPAAPFSGYVSSLKSITNTLACREPSWVKSANAAR
jgi:hypothetical protein